MRIETLSAHPLPESAAQRWAAELFELVAAELPAVLWTADAAGLLTALWAAPGFGLEPGAWLGQPLAVLLGSGGEAAHRAAMRGEAASGQARLSGRSLELRLRPLREAGRAVGAAGLALDVAAPAGPSPALPDQAAEERLALERDLGLALERGELELHYQPQLDLRSGLPFGFEALVRWRHPALGLVPPGRFIPLAEESGLVVPLGAWALGEACRQARAWQAAGLSPVKVGVNVSGLQFDRRDLVQTVTGALSESGLASHWLDLELTESLVMRDVEESARQMARLRALGVSLSVDDFGTGYSSLAYLQRLPIDTLKIDRSFITDVDDAWGTRPLVEAIVGLARALGLGVIAEGVETREQLESLLGLGCERGQGYLFARPLPPGEAERFLAAAAAR